MKDPAKERAADLERRVNAAIAAEDVGIESLRIRPMGPAISSYTDDDAMVSVTMGRSLRFAVEADRDVHHVIEAARSRHENRKALGEQLVVERQLMRDELGHLTSEAIDVLPCGIMDGRRDSFMVFEVRVNLLDETLAWRKHRLRWQPYAKGDGDMPWRFAKRQRRRLKLLGNGDRLDALRVCPVLAARIRDAGNPCTWAGVMLLALEGRGSPDQAAFEEGVLHGKVEMAHHASNAGGRSTWNRNRLSVPAVLPDTVAANITGRPLREVATGPYLPVDAKVTRVSHKGARTVLTVDAATEPLRPLLVETIRRGMAPRPDLDIFPGRADVLANLRRAYRRLTT